MLENNWQSIWNKRKTEHKNLDSLDEEQLVLELKRLDGFDVGKSYLTYGAVVKEAEETLMYLSENNLGGGYDKRNF